MFLQEGESTFDHLISFEGALGGFKENYGSYLLDVSLLYPCCVFVGKSSLICYFCISYALDGRGEGDIPEVKEHLLLFTVGKAVFCHAKMKLFLGNNLSPTSATILRAIWQKNASIILLRYFECTSQTYCICFQLLICICLFLIPAYFLTLTSLL